MPDFLDRLIARSGPPDGGGPGNGAAAAGPERLAGMAMARPRVPGLFERRAPPAPESDLDAEAAPQPAEPGSTDIPRATAPAVPRQPRTHAWLLHAPAAYRGREDDREPPPPTAVAALLPVAPQLVPPPARTSSTAAWPGWDTCDPDASRQGPGGRPGRTDDPPSGRNTCTAGQATDHGGGTSAADTGHGPAGRGGGQPVIACPAAAGRADRADQHRADRGAAGRASRRPRPGTARGGAAGPGPLPRPLPGR